MKKICKKDSIIKKLYRSARSLVIDPSEMAVAAARKRRLLVCKAKWRNNADSPVCLMIDDFANAWHDSNQNGVMDVGEDWGAGLDQTNSAFSFLKRTILLPFPEVCVTFFTVMGPINGFDQSSPFTFSQRIDATPDSSRFFKKVHYNKKFEIAFHGYDHGTPGNETSTHVQEWQNISSTDQSLEKIRKGTQIYEHVFGEKPRGGKTGAYCMNRFVEESVANYGFFWWCRDWTPKTIAKTSSPLLCSWKLFGGQHQVIDIPSTINGRVWFKRQVDNLLKTRQIISIQEHISPSGAGTRYIRPNIVEDYQSLQKIFKYLKTKNVWHATISEIAAYIDTYAHTKIYDATQESFKLRYDGKLNNPLLTLLIDPFCLQNDSFQKKGGFLKIKLPDGSLLARQQYSYHESLDNYLVTLPVQNGTYQIFWENNVIPELQGYVDEKGRISYSHLGFTGTVNLKIPFSADNILKYKNNHIVSPAEYLDDRSVSVSCINASPEDHLIC